MTSLAPRVRFRAFLYTAAGLSLAIATFLSPFASSLDDGLEAVAHRLGFEEHADSQMIVVDAPLPDYSVPGVEEDRVSTALAGFIGTLATLGAAFGLGKLLASRDRRDADS